MGKFFKWLIGISVLLFVGAIFIGFFGYGLLLRTLPNDSGSLKLANLQAPVEVIFDQNAVPHINASNVQDAMHTLGFIHARERLWQMEFLRRVGQGRLSEVLGGATVDTDVFLRTLNMADAAKRSYDRLQPDTKNALIAYAKGVNAFQSRKTRVLEPALGVEFLILGVTPEPWEAWNSLLILKVMGFSLSKNLDTEIQRLALASKGFTSKEIDDVILYGPRDNPPTLPDLRKLYGFGVTGKLLEKVKLNETLSKPFVLDWPTGRSASNNWVISGSKTKSGKPILANDPHLGLTAPSAFYLAHLSFVHNGKKREVIGGTLPGIPMLITGRNSRVAWGLTTTNLDAQDLMIEKINPENDNQYLTQNGWQDFDVQDLEIKISDAESKFLKRRTTHNGPVLPDGFRNLKKFLPYGHVGSLKWTGLADDDTTLDTLYANMFSENVSQFLEGAKYAVSPMQSVVVGDVDGNIALATPGRIPVRSDINLVAGRAPVPGWLPEYGWKTYVQSSEVPTIINPERGALTTANANFLPNDYPLHITYDWAEHFRQARAESLVYGATQKHDIDLSREIIADNFSQPLYELSRLTIDADLVGAGDRGDVLLALAQWNGQMMKSRPEPIIMLAWFRHIHEALFKDDFKEEYKLFDRGRITKVLNILKRGTARDWCDKRNTKIKETCNEILIDTLDLTLAELKAEQGADWQTWEYGKVHLAVSEHRPFSKVGLLSQVFNIEVESSGGPYTLNRGQMDFGEDAPYQSNHAAAYRAIYDFSDLNKSIYIQSTGQSGNFLSQHYRDFAKPWSQSKFISMTINKDSYSENSKGKWVFNPK